jgi:hypothetical protein
MREAPASKLKYNRYNYILTMARLIEIHANASDIEQVAQAEIAKWLCAVGHP